MVANGSTERDFNVLFPGCSAPPAAGVPTFRVLTGLLPQTLGHTYLLVVFIFKKYTLNVSIFYAGLVLKIKKPFK